MFSLQCMDEFYEHDKCNYYLIFKHLKSFRCSNKWYNLSIKGQKLVYFLLQNNLKKITLKAGGIVDLNLQQFAAVSICLKSEVNINRTLDFENINVLRYSYDVNEWLEM
ncbi:hypothetical protein TSAR_014239 [Trichomalopsis sarcophagae]|uniref:Uncharacterized protein n=1 Tax=Trichomalopsis sarcophagae TaxID=543379 RepID=A0A232FK89_9HYME|nr:hypothetical protein TSAR_014239 [Trichomalopsis sarcophagae]